jgi:hypothetical protein
MLAALPPVSTTPVANFATIFPCVVDTGGKFATGVNDTGGKFAASVNDTGGNSPPVSTMYSFILRIKLYDLKTEVNQNKVKLKIK